LFLLVTFIALHMRPEGRVFVTWVRVAWDLVFAAVCVIVACNLRDSAWRIHGYAAHRIGVSRFFTPTTVRITFGVLGAIVITEAAVRL